jgi:uncharacterized metal-binding protein
MGLCLGHDMIFNAKSEAPVTPLIVKDRKLNHRTLEAFSKLPPSLRVALITEPSKGVED